MKLDIPNTDNFLDENGSLSRPWVAFMSKVKNYIIGNSQAGATADRPTSNLNIGTTYYDTTLGYLICVHQVNPAVIWHNGAGVAV